MCIRDRFYINAVATLAVIAALAFMSPAPPSSTKRENVLVSILAGMKFLAVHPVLRWVVLLLALVCVLVLSLIHI